MKPSPSPRIVIIGGVAGGASAATRARRMNERAKIVLLERDAHVSFANCGLPYHIGGAIQDRAKLLVAKPELFRSRFAIDVRVRHEALAIDRKAKVVRIRDHAKGVEYDEPYDKVILAPGAAPLVPDLPGVRAPGVHSLRNIEDMDRILADLPGVRRAAVVGGGFIGLEVAEQLRDRGLEVTLVDRNPQVLTPLDPEMAERLRRELLSHGITVRLGSGLAGVETAATGRASGVRLENGVVIPADLVILGLGVRPSNRLAVEAGLDIGPTGGVRTDGYQRTSDADIYAVGDVAEYALGATGGRGRIPLAGIANRTGRLAGEHAATGKSAPAPAAWGTAILKVFGIAAGLTGDSVKSAKTRGIDARSVHVTANHHAGYYPGAKSLTLKLVYEAGTGRILGAQAFGAAGVDKRLDIVASILHFRGTVADLAQVDLAYAPPFGSAKDAVHMAAFAALNDLEGHAPVVPADVDLGAFQVVDVRDADERASLPLAGAPHAVAIPLNDLRTRAGELDRSRPTVVACHSGLRSHIATRLLRELGFDARNLSGAASVRDLAFNRPEAAPAAEGAEGASCSVAKPCGAPGATVARDPHDELHPRNVLAEASGGAFLLDVRSPAEFRSGHVEGAVNLPLDQVSGGSVKALMGGREDITILLLCAAGGRARTAAKRLQGAGLRTVVVAGGTNACVAAGLPIRKLKGAVISIERQVRIGAGLLVAAGVALGTLVHPGFYGLSGFVGCGLVFAGVTDFCGMGLVLARMPWNR